MDCSGEEKLELTFSGLGAIHNKWGSITIMFDGGRVFKGKGGTLSLHSAEKLYYTHVQTHPVGTGEHNRGLLAYNPQTRTLNHTN